MLLVMNTKVKWVLSFSLAEQADQISDIEDNLGRR